MVFSKGIVNYIPHVSTVKFHPKSHLLNRHMHDLLRFGTLHNAVIAVTAQRFGLAGEIGFINNQVRECNGSPASMIDFKPFSNLPSLNGKGIRQA